MNKFFCAIVICLLIPFNLHADQTTEITGHYRCRGNSDVTKLSFDEDTTVEKIGDTYKFIWVSKEKTFYGTGILNSGVLSIIFWDRAGNKGVVTYHVETNGNLKGKWAYNDNSNYGNEFCERLLH